MKKVIFVFPKSSWKFEKTPYPPLGIGYLTAVLQRNQWEVSIIDGQILEPNEYETRLRNINNEEIIGISTTVKQIEETRRIAKLIKEKASEITVIVGGPGVSVLPEKIEDIDIIMKGEAENTLPKLLENFSCEKSSSQISNLSRVIVCENPNNLDNLPFPTRDLFPLEKYLKTWRENTGMTSTSMISSRGCSYGCVFCDKTISGRKFRARSSKNVVDEMEFLSQRYELDDIFFYDDLFTLDRQRVIEICKEIRERKLEISWSAQGRVDRIDTEMLKEMKIAGCTELYFGVESGSNRILQYLRKGFTREQIVGAFKMCHEAEIQPGMYLIVGVPGETKEDIEATKKLIRECRPYLLNFSYLMPFPGTPLFEKTKQWIKNYNYSQWDEMECSIYNYPFEIDPKEARDEIYSVFQKMVKEGMEVSSLQFCCDQ